MKEKKQCLVTGGAGFIGSHLCDRLLKKGFAVTAVDNLILGRRSHLAAARKNSDFTFIEGDLLDENLLDSVFEAGNFDTVYHLAANSDIKPDGSDRDLKLTFLTTYQVLEAMRRFGVQKMVFASSSAVFGEVNKEIDENYGPARPESFYGAAKLAAEGYISAFSNCCDFQAWIFRFPNVVGSRLTHGVIHDFIAKLKKDPKQLLILGDGTQCKPYLDVDDLLDAMMLSLQKMKKPINYLNVGVKEGTTVRRIAEIVVEEMGLKKVAFEFSGGRRGWSGDVPFYQYDLSRVRKLGWKAEYTSEEAVRRSVRNNL